MTDVGWNKNGLAQQYDIVVPGTFLTPGGFATMGFASPAALGVKLAAPDRQVVVLIGDGGFGQNPSVLATARRERIPVVWVVMNNNAFGTIAGLEKANYDTTYGTVFNVEGGDDMWIDYAAVAQAYGIEGKRVESAEVRSGPRRGAVRKRAVPHRRANAQHPDAYLGPLEHPRHLQPGGCQGPRHYRIGGALTKFVKGHASTDLGRHRGTQVLARLPRGRPPEPSAQIYVAARAGYDYVGLRDYMGLPSEPHLDLTHDARLMPTAVRRWTRPASRSGTSSSRACWTTSTTTPPLPSTSAPRSARASCSSSVDDDPARQVDGLARVAELAGRYGLRVVAEFVPLSSVKTLDKLAELVRGRSTQPGNPDRCVPLAALGCSTGRGGGAAREWLPMLHLCDLPSEAPADLEELRIEVRERRLYVGEGDAAIPELMRRLPDDIVLAIEQPHLERLRVLGATEYATRCLRHARAVIDADVVFPTSLRPQPADSPPTHVRFKGEGRCSRASSQSPTCWGLSATASPRRSPHPSRR